MQRVDPGRVAIFGASGSGKSTLARKLIEGQDRVIIFDVMHEYSGQVVSRPLELMEKLAAAGEKPYRIVYRPPQMSDREKELSDLVPYLFAVQRPYKEGKWNNSLCLVVEEMSLSYANLQRPSEKDAFAEICMTGRHYGIGVIGISQRPADVSKKFMDNASELYCLRQGSHASISTLGKVIGPRATELADLEVGNYLYFKNGELTEGRAAA
tara:strand:- start:1096 stop:1728 length:633 start_codon:yes stop_codon:yes gene_type:complete